MLPITITRIPQAFKEIKPMQYDTWEGDYCPEARNALRDILGHRMSNTVELITTVDSVHRIKSQLSQNPEFLL